MGFRGFWRVFSFTCQDERNPEGEKGLVKAAPPDLFMNLSPRNRRVQVFIGDFFVFFNGKISKLGGGFKYLFIFTLYVGKISNLTNIFQRGWNHQLVKVNIPNIPIPWILWEWMCVCVCWCLLGALEKCWDPDLMLTWKFPLSQAVAEQFRDIFG